VVKADNPFDKKLEIWKNRVPDSVRDASVFVTDTLDLSWASAQSIFEDKATPELALAIYDRVVERMAGSATEPEPPESTDE
jgi:hypothetical protein